MLRIILTNEMYNQGQLKILIHWKTILSPHVSNV